jgi:hypothetical protein
MSLAQRFADGAARLLERRTSRRKALSRAAVAGAAFAVAPIRYLIRPGTAWAVLGPSDCLGGLCTDGYTEFCCQIEGGYNRCPDNTYVAGWWKCTSYNGPGICHSEGVRYYIDCNRMPGKVFPGGCQCAHGDCNQRRVDCNQFRYGQCNTQIEGITEVVCRLVVCQNPSTMSQFNCNDTLAIDDTVCSHQAKCLRTTASQLPGGAGL